MLFKKWIPKWQYNRAMFFFLSQWPLEVPQPKDIRPDEHFPHFFCCGFVLFYQLIKALECLYLSMLLADWLTLFFYDVYVVWHCILCEKILFNKKRFEANSTYFLVTSCLLSTEPEFGQMPLALQFLLKTVKINVIIMPLPSLNNCQNMSIMSINYFKWIKLFVHWLVNIVYTSC